MTAGPATPPPATPDAGTLTVTVGPRNAYTDKDSGLRFYRWRDTDYPSVTSIRRMAGIPHGLHQWALSQVIDYALDHWPDLSERLATGDAAAVKVVRAELRKASTEKRDAAAALGTAVHDAAATRKALTDVGPDVAPRLRQYLDWLEVSGAEILGSEFQCWNPTVGYAGTADLLCRMKDESIWLVDIKTGKDTYSEHALQLIAYLMAEFVGEDNKVDQELTAFLRQASGMAVLHLEARSWEFRALRADPDTFTAFRGLLKFATWMKGHGDIESVTTGRRGGGGKRAAA